MGFGFMNLAIFILTAELASWYGWEHQGRLTASGERFDCRLMTCASWQYPLGTHLRVMRLGQPSKSAVVRVNDRGPAPWTGRQIDLSLAAAQRLRMVERGVVKVKIERVK